MTCRKVSIYWLFVFFGSFSIILTQKSCFLTSFWYMWNTLEKVFISKMKNVWFWLENELKWDQWCRNYSHFFFLFSKKLEPRPSSKCEDLQQSRKTWHSFSILCALRLLCVLKSYSKLWFTLRNVSHLLEGHVSILAPFYCERKKYE